MLISRFYEQIKNYSKVIWRWLKTCLKPIFQSTYFLFLWEWTVIVINAHHQCHQKMTLRTSFEMVRLTNKSSPWLKSTRAYLDGQHVGRLLSKSNTSTEVACDLRLMMFNWWLMMIKADWKWTGLAICQWPSTFQVHKYWFIGTFLNFLLL